MLEKNRTKAGQKSFSEALFLSSKNKTEITGINSNSVRVIIIGVKAAAHRSCITKSRATQPVVRQDSLIGINSR